MKWINKKKQKPPLNTPILAFLQFKYGTLIRIVEYVIPMGKKRAVFGSSIQREEDGTVYGGYPEEHVTHWMPLPEPPRHKKPLESKSSVIE